MDHAVEPARPPCTAQSNDRAYSFDRGCGHTREAATRLGTTVLLRTARSACHAGGVIKSVPAYADSSFEYALYMPKKRALKGTSRATRGSQPR
jgi:hypothetical protein